MFADALAGTPLAAYHDGPLLITASDELYDEVANEIARLMPAGGTVFLLGGNSALDEQVEADVEALGYHATRLGGASRVETAVTIAESMGSVSSVMVATGTDHADALTAGTAAGTLGGAVLLTPGTEPHPAVDAYLADTADATAIGGAAATAYPDLPALRGATRDSTAVVVAEAFFDDPGHVAVTRRDNFPDALAGGAHIAGYGGPLLLTFTDELSPETRAYLESAQPTGVYVYGGSAAVRDEVLTDISELLDR